MERFEYRFEISMVSYNYLNAENMDDAKDQAIEEVISRLRADKEYWKMHVKVFKV